MHIPYGVLEPPVAVATTAVSTVGVGYALVRAQRALEDRTAPLMGVTAACIFAAQMVNFPLFLFGASGHLLGGVLAAVVLGPWAGAVTIAVVLIVQALLFGDGGLDALGANVFNLALVGSTAGYSVYALGRRLLPARIGVASASVVASWFSVMLAAFAFSVELAWSGYAFGPTLSAVLLIHVFIGIGEALITGLVVAYLLKARPDLVYGTAEHERPGRIEAAGHLLVGGLAVALVVAIFLAPFASELPDGLEWAAERLGLVEPEGTLFSAPILDYQFPTVTAHAPVATSIAGLIGTLVVFAVALALGWSLWRAKAKDAPHAA